MVREVDPQMAAQLQREGAVVVDVREPDEWALGHVSGAQLIPLPTVGAVEIGMER